MPQTTTRGWCQKGKRFNIDSINGIYLSLKLTGCLPLSLSVYY